LRALTEHDNFRIWPPNETQTLAKSFILLTDEPGPPRQVEVVDWDQNRVDLKWAAPECDGGAPITAYIVECKERYSSAWVRCCLSQSPDTFASVTETLEAGKAYEFQVRAVNKAGPGKPSEATRPVSCFSLLPQKCRFRGYRMVSFQSKDPKTGMFWRALEWKMWLYFLVILNIL
jgi:hypothetical protein